MSEFSWMEISFGKDYDKNGGHFHSVLVSTEHDDYILSDVMVTFENAGYEIMAVVIDGMNFRRDIWKKLNGRVSIVETFEMMKKSVNQVDAIVAWLQEHDPADMLNWEDSLLIRGADAEDTVRAWCDIFAKRYSLGYSNYGEEVYLEADPFPDFLEINWEKSLEDLASQEQSSVVKFNGEVFYFG